MDFLRTALYIVAATLFCVAAAITSHARSSADEPVVHVVEIAGFKYKPESISVKDGDTVTWINRDIAPHTATANDLSFDTGELKRNESVSITIAGDQKIDYFCKFHPMMKAVLLFE